MAERIIPSKVAIRIKGSKSGQPDIIRVDGTNVEVVHSKFEPKRFTYDAVFDKEASNEKMFDEFLASRVEQVFNGQNVVVLCYGPELTGKSHTLFGDAAESEGIVGMAAEALFAKIAGGQGNYFATTSMVQLRDDKVIDLFNPHPEDNLNLLHHRALGAYVDGAAELEVTSAKAVREYFLQGRQVRDALIARTISLTDPHTIMDIRFEAKDNAHQFTIRQGMMRFVQVGESSVVSRRFDVGLRTLSECIEGLGANREPWHLPTDRSALTRLLAPALGGNAFMVMIGFVDPSEKTYADSIHTLELTTKARLIKTRAVVNKSTVNSTVRELRDEIKKVRGMIDRPHAGEYFHLVNPTKIQKLQLLLEELNRVKKNTWEERRQQSVMFKSQRIDTLKNQNLGFVLAEDAGVPPGMLKSAQSLLTRIVAHMNALTDTQEEYTNLRRVQGLAPDAKLTDEQQKGQLGQLEEKVTEMTVELNTRKGEHKELMNKIVLIENKQRSIFQLAKNASYLEKIKEVDDWNKDISLRRNRDENYVATIAKIEAEHVARLAQIDSKFTGGADVMKLSEEVTASIAAMKALNLEELKLSQERDLFLGLLIEREFRHQLSLEQFEEHMHTTFGDYRLEVEEEKRKIEGRYHRLLAASVTDSLKLQGENDRLGRWIEEKKVNR